MAHLPNHPPPNLRRMVAAAMDGLRVPALGLAIVKDGKVLHSKGYGVRTIGTNQIVHGHTLFGIGSNTKAFTALALGLLIAEGKIAGWHAPVSLYLPGFHMPKPSDTRELQVRDLLVHWSGLPAYAGDLLWWPKNDRPRHDIVKAIQHMRPSYSFRAGYAYDNVFYVVAAELIETVSGMSWEEFIDQRILIPAGMHESVAGHSAARRKENADRVTSPHALVGGILQVIEYIIGDQNNPAGGIWSSANDLATWLLLWLQNGELPGMPPLFSKELAKQLLTPVVPIPISDIPELPKLTARYMWYTLGMIMRDYRGMVMYTHGGLVPGHSSRVILIPEIGLGLGALTNAESTGGSYALLLQLVDYFLGVKPTDQVDWVASFRAYEDRLQNETTAAEETLRTRHESATGPSLVLASYAGLYRDAWFGDVTISIHDSQLTITFEGSPFLTGDVEYLYGDTFAVRWRNRELNADALVTFHFTHDQTIAGATMRRISENTDPSYNFEHLNLVRVGD